MLSIANSVVGVGVHSICTANCADRPISLTDIITTRSVLNEMPFLSHLVQQQQKNNK